MDMWKNNVGECKSWFYGVCNGEEGHPCEKPSPYGCQFKGIPCDFSEELEREALLMDELQKEYEELEKAHPNWFK